MPPTLQNTKTFYSNFSEKVYSKTSYIGILEVLEYICFILILYWYNPFSISTKYPVFTNSLTLLVSLMYVLLFYFLSEKISLNSNLASTPTESGFLLKLLGTVGIFIGSVILLKYLGGFIADGRLGMLTLLRYIIQFTIIIVAIAGVYYLLKPYFDVARGRGKDNKTILTFFFNLIMYLPCLVLSFIDYVKNQYQITTKPMWLLLLAEVVLIILWILIPLGLHAFVTKSGIQLLKDPQYINTEASLGTFAELYGTDADTDTDTKTTVKEKFNYHYALSFWFYLNPQPPNTSPAYNTFTNILTYGDKPAVQFNGALNTLRVLVESEGKPGEEKKTVEIYKTKNVLYQKWNNMVINYDRGTMDVFLNGELVGSRPSIAPYMTYESIQVGSTNGLAGGISNVMYYKNNLTRDTIELMYQALRGRDEPTL
jgi:hypothetical protein